MPNRFFAPVDGLFEKLGLESKGLAIIPGDFIGEIQKLLMGFSGGFRNFLGSFD
jgi:hypothetical protein